MAGAPPEGVVMMTVIPRPAIRALVLAVALALGAAGACAGDPDPTGSPSASESPSPTASASPTGLPGEPVDLGPREGDVVAVVGVEHDRVLDVHAVPGPVTDVVATLAPLADDVVSLGEARLLSDSIWYRVSAAGTTGWVDSSFVQYLGEVDDVTSGVIAQLGSTPRADTMPGLGLLVAEQFASTDPPSRITMTAPASTGDLGEVTYDVIGLGDDSVGGFRLHVFGSPDGSGFTLKSVERTVMCLRGVTDGLCV